MTTTYQLSHLKALEAESIHIIREVAAEFERPVLLFSGGKDSCVMLRLAVKAFWPARLPFPIMHVDTGHNFDEVIAFRDECAKEAGARLIVASVQGVDRRGSGGRRHRTDSLAQPSADHHAARRHRGTPLRRRVRRGAPRRGEGQGQGAGVQLPRRVRAVGPQEPTTRALVALQRPPQPGRAPPGLPVVELDRARHLAVHRGRRASAAVDLLRPSARGLPPRRHACWR